MNKLRTIGFWPTLGIHLLSATIFTTTLIGGMILVMNNIEWFIGSPTTILGVAFTMVKINAVVSAVCIPLLVCQFLRANTLDLGAARDFDRRRRLNRR